MRRSFITSSSVVSSIASSSVVSSFTSSIASSSVVSSIAASSVVSSIAASSVVSSIAASSVSSIGVVGAGQMGMGIALVSALRAKLPVTVLDNSPNQLDRVQSLLDRDIKKERITTLERDKVLARITTTSNPSDMANVDFLIEAVVEDEAVKMSLLKQYGEILNPSAILATNTSSISITRLASVTTRPASVIGMHFMNPVPVMKLVEIIPGLSTSPTTLATTLKLAKAMGKTTTESVDMPGFIANRVLMPYINEAVFVLQEGIATRESIDVTMKLGTGVPMGPLALADFIGLDTCLSIMRVLNTQLGEDKYRPAPLLVKMVDAGRLGKKVKHGFYEYE